VPVLRPVAKRKRCSFVCQ